MSATNESNGSPPPGRDGDRGDDRPDRAAFEEAIESDVSRRRVLQGIGATGTALAIGTTASSGTAAAATSGVVYSPATPTVAGMIAAKKVGDWLTSTNTDVTADKTIMHQMAVSEHETLQSHLTLLDNYLEDTNTLASLEARNAIASAWEDNKSVTQAYNDALDAIREYYTYREINHLETLCKVLTQFSHISNTAWEDDNIGDGFLSTWVENNSDGGAQQLNTISPASSEVTYTLQNGDEHTMEMPEWYFETDANTAQGPLTQSIIDNYDESNELFTFSDGSGNTWETPLTLQTHNVGDVSDGGLPSRNVFDGRDWYDTYQEIRDQSDNVTANYDEQFVQALYDELDAGNISPSDVRGPEGQARFLSGTDDVTADRFKMALLQQLDMGQADLSKTASMSITYEGFTDTEVTYNDNDERQKRPVGYTSTETYEGLLYTSELPPEGIEIGGRYWGGGVVYSVASDGVHAIDAGSGNRLWSYTGIGSPTAVRSSGELKPARVYIANGSGNIHAVDPTDGSQIWTASAPSGVSSLEVSPDGSSLYVGTDGSDSGDLLSLKASDGAEEWSSSDTAKRDSIAVSYDGSTVFASASSGDYLWSIDAESGGTNWQVSSGLSSPQDIATSPDGEYLYVGSYSDELLVYNQSDGSEANQSKSYTDAPNGVAVSPDSSTVYCCVNSTLYAYDASDLSEKWRYSASNTLFKVRVSPSGDVLYMGSSGGVVHAVDAADGSERWTYSGHSNPVNVAVPSLMLHTAGPLDGHIGKSLMYDAPSDTELSFPDGIVKIEEMTDRDGNVVDHTGDDWGAPEYDTYDATEFVNYVKRVEEFQKQLETENEGISFPSPTDGSCGGGLVGGFLCWFGNLLGFGDLSWLRDNIAGFPMWAWIAGVAAYFSITGDS